MSSKSTHLSIMGLENVTDNTKERKNMPTVGQRTKTTRVK